MSCSASIPSPERDRSAARLRRNDVESFASVRWGIGWRFNRCVCVVGRHLDGLDSLTTSWPVNWCRVGRSLENSTRMRSSLPKHHTVHSWCHAGVDEKTDYSYTLECWAGPCASGHRRSWRLCQRSVRQRQDLPYYSITGSSITNIWLSTGGMYCTILGYVYQRSNHKRGARRKGSRW